MKFLILSVWDQQSVQILLSDLMQRTTLSSKTEVPIYTPIIILCLCLLVCVILFFFFFFFSNANKKSLPKKYAQYYFSRTGMKPKNIVIMNIKSLLPEALCSVHTT